MNYYLAREGQAYGPYPEESIPTMLHAGQLVPEDLLCAEGSSEWLPVNQIPAFAAATPPPVRHAPAPADLSPTARASQRHAEMMRGVGTAQDWAPRKPTVAERAMALLGNLKLFAYGIVALVIVGVVIAGFLKGQREAKAIEKFHDLPGWSAFAAANEKIESESSEAGYGNNAEASRLSARLASVLGKAQQASFTMEKGYRGRSKIGMVVSAVDSATAGSGKFQTFLETRDDRAILLIHVPEYKRYKGATRESMRQMCLEVARVGLTAAKKAEIRTRSPQPTAPISPARRGTRRTGATNNVSRVSTPPASQLSDDFTLVIGLRDKSSYDCVFARKLSDPSFTEELTAESATGNVESHQLLVQWFGSDKPK